MQKPNPDRDYKRQNDTGNIPVYLSIQPRTDENQRRTKKRVRRVWKRDDQINKRIIKDGQGSQHENCCWTLSC